jgi:hypothetical protein
MPACSFWEYLRIDLAEMIRSTIVLSDLQFGEPMQNVEPTDFPRVNDHLSPVSAVIEQEADYV